MVLSVNLKFLHVCPSSNGVTLTKQHDNGNFSIGHGIFNRTA